MIPQDISKRVAYESLIKRGVALLMEQESLKEDLSTIKEEVKDVIGKDYVTSFGLILKARMDEQKLQEQADKNLEAIELSNILRNGG